MTAGGPGVAFLLSQLGAHAAGRFADAVRELGLTPAQAGLLRAVASRPGESQRALADHLGTQPSRLVALIDQLAARGVLERRDHPADRRLHALHLTAAGADLLRRLGAVARAHEDDVCRALDAEERARLLALLGRIADDQGLTAGVHPGYRSAPDHPSGAVPAT